MCLDTPFREIGNRAARSPTFASPLASVARIARRVGSATARKVASSAALLSSTIGLIVDEARGRVKRGEENHRCQSRTAEIAERRGELFLDEMISACSAVFAVAVSDPRGSPRRNRGERGETRSYEFSLRLLTSLLKPPLMRCLTLKLNRSPIGHPVRISFVDERKGLLPLHYETDLQELEGETCLVRRFQKAWTQRLVHVNSGADD